ncbi:MAG: phage tail terminator-like protein [Beijerinckiaceae bacterium]
MPAETDIENAIKARIGTASLVWPIAWPNQDMPEPKPIPRIEVYIDRNGRSSVALSGGGAVSFGFVRVLVVDHKGASTADANAKADAVAALFPMALRIAVPNGNIVMTNEASIRSGFRDGSQWVIPVIAPYRAEPLRA